jgi:hypothetical protein
MLDEPPDFTRSGVQQERLSPRFRLHYELKSAKLFRFFRPTRRGEYSQHCCKQQTKGHAPSKKPYASGILHFGYP